MNGSEVVAESARARLVRRGDGLLGCECPYACMAVSEPCAFSEHPEFKRQQEWYRRRADRGKSRTPADCVRWKRRWRWFGWLR